MKNYIGKTVKIGRGTKVSKLGRTTARNVETVVTVRGQELTPDGRIRLIWKSNGYKATTIV